MNQIGNKIDILIRELRIDRMEFAERLGMTPNAISNWKKRELGTNVIKKIVTTFPQVRKEWLMNGTGNVLNTKESETNAMRTRIKQLIELSGLTSADFATKIGVDTQAFEKKLSGEAEIEDEDLMLISKGTNVRLGWIVAGAGQMFLAPERMRQQVAIDSYRAQMLEKKEEEKSDFESSTILEIYSKCIRQLEDDRAQVRKELEEMKEVRQQLADELGEIRNLKAILHDAINAFKANGSASYRPLIAADDNT